MHLIRASLRYVAYADRKTMAAEQRKIYAAVNADAAQMALLALGETELGLKYPAALAVWERSWERFTPFLAFPPAVRKVICTTNSIESLNFQLRKIIKNRGHFPSDDAVVKLLWLAIRDIEDKRERERAKGPVKHRNAETTGTVGWTQALNALAMSYPDRLPHRGAVMPQMASQPPASGLPTSPWVLVDDDTIGQTAGLLENLTTWLLTARPLPTNSLAHALSRGEADHEEIAHWIDALAARLRRCAQTGEL